jgi:hypothetical protein
MSLIIYDFVKFWDHSMPIWPKWGTRTWHAATKMGTLSDPKLGDIPLHRHLRPKHSDIDICIFVHVLGAVPPISILYRHPKNVRWPFFFCKKKVGALQSTDRSPVGARLWRTCFPPDSDMFIMLGNNMSSWWFTFLSLQIGRNIRILRPWTASLLPNVRQFQMLFVVCPSVHPFWGLVEVV